MSIRAAFSVTNKSGGCNVLIRVSNREMYKKKKKKKRRCGMIVNETTLHNRSNDK